MEENIMVAGQELVEKSAEQIGEAITNAIPTAVTVTTQNTVPAVTQAKVSNLGKTIAIDAGIALGGAALGAAFDHWVVPKIKEAWENHKIKKAEKKAAKKAAKEKKAEKKAGKKPEHKPAPKEPEPSPETEQEEDVITADVSIKD